MTERTVHFSDTPECIELRAGDALVFRSDLCHAGAALDVRAPISVAVHFYAGVRVTKFHMSNTWHCGR